MPYNKLKRTNLKMNNKLKRTNPEEEYQAIRATALEVIKQFNGLSPAAFWAEVEWRMWPRPTENDIKNTIMRMICNESDIDFSIDRKIIRRNFTSNNQDREILRAIMMKHFSEKLSMDEIGDLIYDVYPIINPEKWITKK